MHEQPPRERIPSALLPSAAAKPKPPNPLFLPINHPLIYTRLFAGELFSFYPFLSGPCLLQSSLDSYFSVVFNPCPAARCRPLPRLPRQRILINSYNPGSTRESLICMSKEFLRFKPPEALSSFLSLPIRRPSILCLSLLNRATGDSSKPYRERILMRV